MNMSTKMEMSEVNKPANNANIFITRESREKLCKKTKPALMFGRASERIGVKHC